ncbi:MAG: asparagine synthase (glutamine-hydrolyzing), partial [Alphaproteobacteria bacterium]|nr:asparagine synthase (glutamine-hydrolyzing) [Alphaproteobacteria bacterium]
MCGVAGLVGAHDDALLDRFKAALAHRGPDGAGVYRNGACALAHTRLAIVDLAGGDQPFVTRRADGGEVALVANGEIYNNPELRAEMPGVDFACASDCEPPLHLYLRHGLDFSRHLRGMYAIAIWDAGAGRLVLARDPFGIKPLYYAETAKGFAFASEPRALIDAGLVDARLDPAKRDEFLQLQFTTGADLPLAGIRRVLPGETVAVENGRIVERRRIDALPDGKPRAVSKAHALSELDRVLNDTVGVHQRADVPYAMFLSWGIDSSVLLAMMSRLNPDPVTAFTAGFAGPVHDEREHARELARAERAPHVEVEFGAEDLWTMLPAIARHMDDPVADYATLPTWKLAQTARAEGFKVVLAGEGGDELFAGYGRYRAAKRLLFPKELYRKGILDGLHVLAHDDPARVWRAGMARAGTDARRL